MLKLKVQYFGHLFRRADSSEKTLMLGKIEGKRRRGGRGWNGWMASLSQWTWVWANSRRQWRMGKPGMLPTMGSQRVRYNLVTEQQQQYTHMYTHMCNASYIYMCVCVSFSVMSNFVSPWTVVPKLLCSWKSPGKNTGVGKPFPSPGEEPNPGIKPRFPCIAGGFFTIWATREAHIYIYTYIILYVCVCVCINIYNPVTF